MNILAGGTGTATRLAAGDIIRIVNTHGSQTVDFWGLREDNPEEHFSVEQTRRKLYNLHPGQGDVLFSNRRTELMRIETDTAAGSHDTLFDCCDEWVYRDYGAQEGHPSCRVNFATALAALGIPDREAPRPLNLWMNVSVEPDGRIAFERPQSQPGDLIEIRALVDMVVLMSACPMDITPVNGGDGTPQDVAWEILAGRGRK